MVLGGVTTCVHTILLVLFRHGKLEQGQVEADLFTLSFPPSDEGSRMMMVQCNTRGYTAIVHTNLPFRKHLFDGVCVLHIQREREIFCKRKKKGGKT